MLQASSESRPFKVFPQPVYFQVVPRGNQRMRLSLVVRCVWLSAESRPAAGLPSEVSGMHTTRYQGLTFGGSHRGLPYLVMFISQANGWGSTLDAMAQGLICTKAACTCTCTWCISFWLCHGLVDWSWFTFVHSFICDGCVCLPVPICLTLPGFFSPEQRKANYLKW